MAYRRISLKTFLHIEVSQILDFSHTDFYFQTTNAEEPSKGTNTCMIVGLVMFLALLFTIGFCIGYFCSGNAAQREKYLERKFQMFSKDELQVKLFAQGIIESIGKFWIFSHFSEF